MRHRFAAANPLDAIQKPAAEEREPGILTPKQVERLLNTALEHPELEVGWFITLALFCGVRSEELHRLRPEDVHLTEGFVNIGPRIAKKRRIRNVDFTVEVTEEVAVARPKEKARKEVRQVKLNPVTRWLSRFAPPACGKVQPPGFERRIRRLRELAGITDWPSNGMRHSYASYLYELTGNSALVCARLGHAQDDVLFEHCRALVRKGEGRRYFQIEPPALAANVIPIAQTAA